MAKAMIMVAVLLFALPAQADLIAAKTPYWDVDKDMTDDTLLCWAAAASNALMATGWAVDYDGNMFIDPKADVFQEFRDHFPNEGGWAYEAYEYYFAANYPLLDYRDYYEYVWAEDAVQEMTQHFQRGFPVSLNFHGVHRSGNFDIYHAITAWAIDLDSAGTGTIYVTDSDDAHNWGVFGTQAYDIWWEQGAFGLEWYFDYGGAEFPRSRIRSLEVLFPIPEPAVWVLVVIAAVLACCRPARVPTRS